jgi:hypothetical protein
VLGPMSTPPSSFPSAFPGSPKVIKGGIVLIDPDSSRVQRVIVLQYNPDSISRTLQVQGVGGESGDRLEALRLKGPAVETIKLDAEIDATDQLELPTLSPANQIVVQHGLAPHLAALETVIYPSSSQLQSTNTQAQFGVLEIAPVEASLTLFVWSASKIVPVRITEFSITEEAFDTALNPMRAKVSLGMRVLSVNDLPFGHKGSSIFLAYLRQKESLAALAPGGDLSKLGIGGIP